MEEKKTIDATDLAENEKITDETVDELSNGKGEE